MVGFRHGHEESPLRYLITGGAGFIGSHVADALVDRGDQVVILDDFSTGRRANIEHLAAHGSAVVVEGSATDAGLVEELVAQCDCCLHLASAVGVKLVVAEPLETLRRNVLGADVVISATARQRKQLLYSSTSEVYGKNGGGAVHEESDRVLGSTFKSRWSYAIAKSYGEALVHGYTQEHGAKMTVVRLFNTIGPRQIGAYGMVVPRLARQALVGEDVTVYGDGSQSRCFLHVFDAVEAILSVLGEGGAYGRAFNVGSDAELRIIELAHRIIERAGSKSRVTFMPYDEAYGDGFEELGRRKPDTSAIHALTGWRPMRTTDQAIDDVLRYLRDEQLASPTNGNGAWPGAGLIGSDADAVADRGA